MPTYEYECDNCGQNFEIFQSIKDEPASVCEKCGGHLTKLLSAGTGLIFKGSGFYITDYKTKTGGENSGASSSKTSDNGGGSDKPAAKSSETSTKSESTSKTGSETTKAAKQE